MAKIKLMKSESFLDSGFIYIKSKQMIAMIEVATN